MMQKFTCKTHGEFEIHPNYNLNVMCPECMKLYVEAFVERTKDQQKHDIKADGWLGEKPYSHTMLDYGRIARELFPVQPMPPGTPFYMDYGKDDEKIDECTSDIEDVSNNA